MTFENPEKNLNQQTPSVKPNVLPSTPAKTTFLTKVNKLSSGLKFLIGGAILWIIVPAFCYLLSRITGMFGYVFVSLAGFFTAIGALGILIGITLSFIKFIKHLIASHETDTVTNGDNTSTSTPPPYAQATAGLTTSPSRRPRKRLYLVFGILGLLTAPILFFGIQIMIWGAILGDSPSAADTQAAIPFQIFSWVIYIVFTVAGLVLLPLAFIQYYRSHKQALDAAQASSNKAAISQKALKLRDYFKSLAMFILFFPFVLAYLNMMQLAYIGAYSRWAIVYYLPFVAAGVIFFSRSYKYKNISQQNSV